MKKLTQACGDSESPFDTNGDANFWLARRRERLSTDYVLQFCRKWRLSLRFRSSEADSRTETVSADCVWRKSVSIPHRLSRIRAAENSGYPARP
jgi:hypothetical protein